MADSKEKNENDLKQRKDNIRKLDEEIIKNRKIPIECRKKINKRILYNGVILLLILIYLGCLNVFSLYIETSIYLKLLKIFSIFLAVISIIYFEIGYKKDDENIFLYGIEFFIIALLTLFCCYAYELYFNNYNRLLLIIKILIAVYYLLKIIYVNKKMKKEYYESLNDIKDITKKG